MLETTERDYEKLNYLAHASSRLSCNRIQNINVVDTSGACIDTQISHVSEVGVIIIVVAAF